jgi:hypothetical protein
MKLPARFSAWGFAGLAVLVVLLATSLHVYRLSGMAFTNYDDMRMSLIVNQIRLLGWQPYYDLAQELAVWQGRAYFYFSMIFFLLPYFLHSLFWRGLLSALLQLAASCSIGAVVSLYAGFRTALWLVALACAALPYWHTWYPVDGYLFVYHLPVILFFAGLAVYIRLTRGEVRPAWRRRAQVFWWSAFFVSLFFYEALLPVFFLIVLAVSTAETTRGPGVGLSAGGLGLAPAPPAAAGAALRRRAFPFPHSTGAQSKWSLPGLIRAWLPWVAGFAVWTALYLGYRHLHPSTYDGSALAGYGRKELGEVAASLVYYEALSLPGANWVGPNMRGVHWIGNLHRTTNYWLGSTETLSYPRFFFRNLTPDGIVLAGLILAAAVFWCLSFRRDGEAPPRRVGKAAALALLCALVSPLALEMTTKYRSLEVVQAVVPYMPGYYSFLAWCAVLAMAFPLLGAALRRLPLRLAAAVLLALACGVAAAANAAANDALYREYSELTDKWKLVDLLAHTRWFAELPPDPVFVASANFFDNFPSTYWMYTDEYWTTYFSAWAHRPVRVIRDPRLVPELLNRKMPVFYLEHQWLPGRLEAVLLIDPIREISPTDGYARGDSLLLVSRSNPANLALEYSTAAGTGLGGKARADGGGERAAGLLRVRLPEGRREQGAYLSQLQLPGLIAGTAHLTDQATAPPPPPFLEFGRGFSALTERGGDGHYWRWSDGKDGEGELNLINLSAQPVAVRFRAGVRFYAGPGGGRAAFDFTLPHGAERIMAAPEEMIESVWELEPGVNRVLIKCHAGRLPAPGDPRYIVFGLADWSVVALSKP